MEIIKGINNSTVINDSYNASYDSMKAAIEYLDELKGGKRIAVLGDILELGDFGEEIHKKVGEEVAKNKPDILITVGNLAKYIAEIAKDLGMEGEKIFVYDTKEEAIKKLRKVIEPNDFILIKASNSMKFEEIVNVMTNSQD